MEIKDCEYCKYPIRRKPSQNDKAWLQVKYHPGRCKSRAQKMKEKIKREENRSVGKWDMDNKEFIQQFILGKLRRAR